MKSEHPECLLPKLTHLSKPNIPFIAQSVNLSYSSVFGYHLTAKQNLRPGNIIMTESPYSAPLLPDFWYEKCATCLKCGYLNLIPCRGCSFAMFCSNECMTKGFQEFHQYECPIMQDIGELLSAEALIGLRNTLKGFCLYENLAELQEVFDHRFDGRQEDFDLEVMNCDAKTMFRVICHQATNQERRSIEDLLNLSLTAGVIYKLLVFKTDLILKLETPEQHYLLMEMLLHFLQIATINSFSMTCLPEISLNTSKGTRVETEHEFAIATYPFSSFLNHSCAPNVTKTNAGPSHETMLVVVTRPIKVNEQIFDCYFTSVHHYRSTKRERQKLLYEQYNFQCSCMACQLNFPLYKDLKIKCPMLNLMEIISGNASLGRFSEKKLILQKYQEYCQFLREFDECYPCKEIYVVHKCLLRCIWLLYKRLQVIHKPSPKSQKDIIFNLDNH
ncbi:SET and MYND domain-containing protein 4-like [Culicoides brevitarsis]|uniref:SET and MYND domain-containing protein 4-like n=1 Tax=Culicoides brevitarsis TaxID=469753 RepID=UPI00307C6267